MNLFLTGVGSRQTPINYAPLIDDISKWFITNNYTLRSGGADGADTFFENSFKQLNANTEIYLPWKGFNNNPSNMYHITDDAITLAGTIHPAWDKCSRAAKLLHARNCYQLLGYDLCTPSNIVVCYTENGKTKGGTATVITLANKLNIPIFNIGSFTNCNFDHFTLFLEKHSLL